MSIRQLRIYTVAADRRDAFRTRWAAHARPLMAEHGFHLVEEWEASARPTPVARVASGIARLRRRSGEVFEFGYVLEWDDAEHLERGWAAFLSDERWRAAKAATRRAGGEPVLLVTDRVLR